MDSSGGPAHAARSDDAVVGQHSGGRETLPATIDGSRGGVHRARGHAGRPARRRARSARLWREHVDLLHLGRQRIFSRGPERHDQRADRAERHSFHCGHAHQGARGPRWSRCARVSEDRQPVPCWMGLGRQHAVQRHEAHRVALRWNPQPDGGSVAREDHAGHDTAHAIPSCERRRPDDLRGPWHLAAEGSQRVRPGSDRRRELRVFL